MWIGLNGASPVSAAISARRGQISLWVLCSNKLKLRCGCLLENMHFKVFLNVKAQYTLCRKYLAADRHWPKKDISLLSRLELVAEHLAVSM